MNPIALSAEVLASGRAPFADHCATCHGNDGKGATTIGKNLYPKAPDMPAALGDIRVGGRVVVTAREEAGAMKVLEVHLSAPKAEK